MINAKTKDARILFVDDQEANVAVLETLLEREGYTRLLGITDPRQVYKAYLEFSPDLIILDLIMPNMDGFAVLEQLRPAIPADTYLPILILTADITPEARARALSGGAKDFITKPIDILEVSLRIRNLLETRFLHLQIQNRSQILNDMVVERTTDLTHANEELTRTNRKLQTEISERQRAETRAQQEKARAEALLNIASSLNNQLNLDAVLHTVCEAAAHALNTPGATVYLYNQSQDILELAASYGFPANYASMVKPLPRTLYEMLTAQTPYLEDIHLFPEAYDLLPVEALDIRSVAGVNLKRRDQLIGGLTVYTFSEERQISSESLTLLQGMAHQAAQAIANARLYEDAQRRLQNIQALHRMDLAISGSLDIQISLKIILEELTRHLHVDAANVLTLNPYMSTLEFTVGHGFKSIHSNKSTFRLGEGLPGKIALTRNPIHIADQVEKQLETQRFNALAPEKFRAYYGLPLIAKAQVQGVIEIFHRSPLNPDAEWLEFVETIAGQAAIAIENINLFNKLQRSNTELALAYDITLEGWSRAMDLRDRETEGHTQRVAEMTVKLGQTLGLSDAEIVNARRGALLHDMGKLGIPDEILLKPGQLSEEEWEIMKKHPSYAYEMLSPISYLRPALDIPYCHHEKWDGTGYPRGLRSESIPIAARIFSVADVWDALRSDRPYRKAWSNDKVIAYIQEHSGSYFDPRVVEAFMKVVQQPGEAEPKASIRKMFLEE